MPPLFATIRKVSSSAVNAVFGSDVTWTPASGGSMVAFKGVFNDPTDAEKMDREGNIMYQAIDNSLRIDVDDCRALVDLISTGVAPNSERLYVEGVSYFIRNVSKLYDGSHILFYLVKE